MNDALALAVQGFAVDRVTAEVTAALAAAGIPSVLLKGPAIATWLYGGDESRLYGDTDLLLREADWERAMAVLAGLGFEDELADLAHPRMESGAGYSWVRPGDDAAIDLHLTLFGIRAAPAAVWESFGTATEVRRVGGAEVALPPRSARLLHIVLHAVQHGGAPGSKSMLDLERAIGRGSREEWTAARRLAERLDCAGTFAAGLRLSEDGGRLAAAIGAAREISVEAAVRTNGVPMSEGFRQLAAARGAGAKLALLARELFPTAAFMRWHSPLARRGRLGLLAAYLRRPFELLYRAPPAYLAWRRANRR